MKNKILLISVLILISISDTFTQTIKSFTPDTVKYIDEMRDFLSNTRDKKEAKEFMNQFEEVWTSGKIGYEQKKRIFLTSNLLLQKRAPAYPCFVNYLKSIINFTNSKQDMNSYYEWERGISFILNKKNTALAILNDYLDISVDLISSNYLNFSPTTKWQASSSNWKFVYDNTTVKVIFNEDINLTCKSGNDSSVIIGTNGIFYILDKRWKGANGKVTWERTGLHPLEVYAELRNYQLDLRKLGFEADSVTFINRKYFKDALYGKITDKVINGTTPESAIFPQFESYTKRFKIKNIYKNVDYDGGFSMKGGKFIGEGNARDYAKLIFYRNDTALLIASARVFAFKNEILQGKKIDVILGQNTVVCFRLDTDSIYHPGLAFKFFVKERLVWLYREKAGMALCNYINTYHKVDMDFEVLTWNIDEPKIEFKFLPGQRLTATFMSEDYFRESTFLELQGSDNVNPINAVKNFTKKINSNEFKDEQFADFMNMSLPQVHQYLMGLLFKGLIIYDMDNGNVKVKDRLYNYQKASVGKKDYDVIKFSSISQGTDVNGKLNLINFNLMIKGVEEISLSDSQNVAIFPKDQEMTLKRNRNFTCDGKIRAGLFLFKGSNFYFEYDKFKINLTRVDEVRMRVNSEKSDDFGQPIPIDLKSTLTDVTGDLLIGDPNNKSGIKHYPKYPIFNSKKDCYVYYDDKSIQNGKYTRDKFYFQVYPFSIDSLNNFTKRGLQFGGNFVSGGIFPPFEDSLRIQNDYSLGFIRNTPVGGYPLYGGKGSFLNKIKLSNEGLRGDGDIKYVTSLTKSDNFLFYPDSMNTIAQSYHVEKQKVGVEFPNVDATDAFVHWMPYKDYMLTSKIQKPLTMYDSQATMNGTLKIEPKGLSGWGRIDILETETRSNLFVYKADVFDADTADFLIKSQNMVDFNTKQVSAHFDFIQRKGEFKSLGKGSLVEFPKVQYICFMDQFVWHMDKGEIGMTSTNKGSDNKNVNKNDMTETQREDIELEGSEFKSIHPKQDSLSFIAPEARYSLRANVIRAERVKYIRVADGTIYLTDGKVTVEKAAVMNTLLNTRVLANNTTRYHTFYNATTNIYGRYSYTSSGDYDYIDETKNKQKIHFDVIGVDTTKQTYARGKISIADNFTLSPNYAYYGDVQVNASKQFMKYLGSVKLSHECEILNKTWLNFMGDIDPNDIYIPLDSTLKDNNGNKLANGFVISNDSAHIYSTFFTKIKKPSDKPVLSATGFLFFDKSDKKYKVSTKEKLNEFNLPGNYVSIHRSVCNMYGEGKINLNLDFGQIKLTTTGNMGNDLSKNIIDCELLMGVDFFFSDKCLEMIAKSISDAASLEPADISSKTFEKALTEYVGQELANEMISQYATKGELKKIPKELSNSFLFSGVVLKWNTKTHSYVSSGKIGVVNILKNQINKKVDGHIEYIKKKGGDVFNIYLEIDEKNWYYFTYSRGVMQAFSSNTDFNNVITELKKDARTAPSEKGQQPFAYYIGNVTGKMKFLKRFLNEDNGDEENNDNENKENK